MLSPDYSIIEFVEKVQHDEYKDLVLITRTELTETESRSYNQSGAFEAREKGSLEYAAMLKGFLFYLDNGFRPAIMSKEQFCTFIPILEQLVERDQFNPSTLEQLRKTL